MAGVRILEVAQFMFAPSASGILADWGADVIRIEHPVNGDAARGFVGYTGLAVGSFMPMMEHANRGKRSIGLDIASPAGRAILMELAATSDVFLTNFLPDARRRLRIDVEDLREANPDIIYVRASALGAKGPEAELGGYDSSVFWARGGSAAGVTPPEFDGVLPMPGGAYGDSIGGMTLAGGIAGALFARSSTGEPSIVDVSLLSVATWVMGLWVDCALLTGEAPPQILELTTSAAGANPLTNNYQTSDGRWIALAMMQPSRYWEAFSESLGRPDLAKDERFSTFDRLLSNAAEARSLIAAEIQNRSLAEWTERFATFEGQWAPVQNPLELGNDAQVRANGYISEITDVEGNSRSLVVNPVQFDERPPSVHRAPQFAEHTDEVIRMLGYDDDRLLELKLAGTIT